MRIPDLLKHLLCTPSLPKSGQRFVDVLSTYMMWSFQNERSLQYNDNEAKLKCSKFQENLNINIASNVVN